MTNLSMRRIRGQGIGISRSFDEVDMALEWQGIVPCRRYGGPCNDGIRRLHNT